MLVYFFQLVCMELHTRILILMSTAPCQEGPGIRFGEVGQRSSAHGQASSGLDPPGPLVRRPRECLRPPPRRPVRPGHEESPHSAGAGAGEREHKAQHQ